MFMHNRIIRSREKIEYYNPYKNIWYLYLTSVLYRVGFLASFKFQRHYLILSSIAMMYFHTNSNIKLAL